jgi:hypothetical protein
VSVGTGAHLDVLARSTRHGRLRRLRRRLERFYAARERALDGFTPRAFGFLSESGAALLAVDRLLEVPDGETLGSSAATSR